MYQDISVAASGISAQAKILFPAKPTTGDTVTINGIVYTFGIANDFYVTGTTDLNNFPIWSDRDKAALVANLANKIRATNGLGFTAYPEGPVLWIVALAAGTAANAWTLSTSNSTAITVPATFSGGV